MDEETLRATIDFFCHGKKYVEFIWHGGEPLLTKIDFYRKSMEYQRVWIDQGVKVVNFLQTNATLVDKDWVRFLSENGFLVGVSIDGPERFHDQNRRHSNDNGSYKAVMRGINLLRDKGVFNGAICGISAINQSYPEEIFNFFIDEGIKKLKFARIKDIGHCNDISALSVSFEEYIGFMISMFDLWLELDDPEVEIRDIQSVVNLILGGKKRECIYMGQCEQFVTVYRDGSIFGCDSFPKEDTLSFGNVFEGPAKVRSNPKIKAFQEKTLKRARYCQSCDWQSICRGGCAKDHYENLDSDKPLPEHCKELIRYFEYISTRLRKYKLV